MKFSLQRRLSREGALGLYFTVGFLLCALLAALFGLLACEVFSEGYRGSLDREVLLAMRELQTPLRSRVAYAVTFFGNHSFLLPAVAAVAAVLAFRGQKVSALLFAVSALGVFGLNSAVKIAFARARPDLWPALLTERTHSFPSGHAAMSAVFFGGVACMVFRLTRSRAARLGSTLAATIAVSSISASRVYLGVHWLTDVVAGALLGLFWVVVYSIGTEFFARKRLAHSVTRRSRAGGVALKR